MATNRTMQTGDTWPPLKGLVGDVDGPVDLTAALSIRALLKSDAALIELPVTVIDPIEVVNPGEAGEESFNWSADWEPGDTDTPGSYLLQIEVTWNANDIEKFPNRHSAGPTVTIEAGND